MFFFFFSSRRRHTRWNCDWSSDVCSSDLRWRGAGPEASAVTGSVGRGRVAPRSQRRDMLGGVPDEYPFDGDDADPGPAPAGVTLVVGPEEYLAERAVARMIARAREIDPAVEVRRLGAPDLEDGSLLELT